MNNGGPAFPERDAKGNLSPGMSLRDYFAAACLCWSLCETQGNGIEASEVAYGIADAMLAEREKNKPNE